MHVLGSEDQGLDELAACNLYDRLRLHGEPIVMVTYGYAVIKQDKRGRFVFLQPTNGL